jgi:hypothetical protein
MENIEICFGANAAVLGFCKQFSPFGSFDWLSNPVVEYLSPHFYELPPLFLNNLPPCAIGPVSSQDSLKMENKDSLLNFFASHLEIDRE